VLKYQTYGDIQTTTDGKRRPKLLDFVKVSL